MSPDSRISPVTPETERPLLFQVFTDDQRWVNGIKPELEKYGTVEILTSEDFFVDRPSSSPPDIILLHPSERFGRNEKALHQLWKIKNSRSDNKPVICYFAAAPMSREATGIITNGGNDYASLSYDPTRIKMQIRGLVQLEAEQQSTN